MEIISIKEYVSVDEELALYLLSQLVDRQQL
jgi:hypothetical protein